MDEEDSMDIKDEDIDQYLENEQKAMMVAMGGSKAVRGENPLVPYTHQMLPSTNYNFSIQQGNNTGMPMQMGGMPADTNMQQSQQQMNNLQGVQPGQQQQQQKQTRPYDSANRGPRGPYGFRGEQYLVLKRENGDGTTIILPFRTKRVEKNNNNGVRKQARLEIRKRMVNERVKLRARL